VNRTFDFGSVAILALLAPARADDFDSHGVDFKDELQRALPAH